MYKVLVRKIFLLIIIGLNIKYISFGNNNLDANSIYFFKQNGWEIIEKKEFFEFKSGIKPYQSLKRVIQVTNFKLRKAHDIIFCIIKYDSQQDKLTENCTFITNKS